MVQTFTDLHYTADLQSSTVLSIAKTEPPHNLLTKWTEHIVKCAIEIPTLLHFQHWLGIQAEVIEKLEPFLTTDTAHQPDSTERDVHRSKPSTSTPKKQRSCPLCNQSHFIAACPHYLEASTSDKLALVRKHQLCFNCLSCTHQKNDCPSRNHCFVPGCSAMHHTSLHPVDKTAPRSSPTVHSADTSKPPSNRNSDTSQLSTHTPKLQPSNNLQNSRRSQQSNPTKSPHFNATAMNDDNSKLPTDLLSVLQVIPVSIMNGKQIVDTYALIDPGSTGTYIVENIAKSIDLKTDRKFNMNVQFLSASKSLPVSLTNFTIAPYADNEKTFSVQNAFCTDHINLPPADTDELNTICQSSPHLRHIKFPDINNGHIGVLLGTACIAFTYALEWIRGSTNHPSGIRTELGWTIAGEFHVPRKKKSRQINSLIFYANANLSPEQSLSTSPDFLQQFWDIEKTAVEPQIHQTLNEEEQQALQTLRATIRHTGERYEIGLPWKPHASLPNNYFTALSQLRSLHKRLKEKPDTLQKFNSTIESDLQKKLHRTSHNDSPTT